MDARSAAAAAAAAVSSPAMFATDSNGTAVPDGGDAFDPSIWGVFFATYVPPPTQRSEEWMRERAEELKRRVSRMFQDGDAMSRMAKTVALVDTIERLGLDSHFREEIAAAISHIHSEEQPEFADPDDLHVAATRFRLLRQHGVWVSTDVFDKFRDGAGNFHATDDARALLSLYHAAHMAVPGESALDDATAFTRRHLEAIKDGLRSPAAEQVARALDHPLPRYTGLLETMHYVAEYAQEEGHDDTLLELARLNSNLMRSLYLRELNAMSLWWRDLYDAVNLTYTRDRLVETYFWGCGMIPAEEHSRGRLFLIKAIGLISILDDTYDVHATLEECQSLTEAFQRWDESAVSDLPEYLRTLYIKTLSNFKEFEDILGPHEKYQICYATKAYQQQSKYYLQEAQWSNNKYQPSIEEHEKFSAPSTALAMLYLTALAGYDSAIVTKEMLEWMSSIPAVVHAGRRIGRFLNDISSYKSGKTKKDVSSTVECYMLEKGLTGEEAVAAITAKTEHSWRVVNLALIETDRALLPAVQLVDSMAKACEVWYLRGRDCYTHGSHAKDLVTALFLDPIPL